MTKPADIWRARALRTLVGVVFWLSFVFSDAVTDGALNQAYLLGGLGLIAAATVAAVWGPGSRPRPKAAWVLLLPVAVALPFAAGWPALSLGFLIGLFLVHDMRVTPSLMLASGIVSALLHFDYDWRFAAEPEAWWVGLCVLSATAAAVLERDRLAEIDGPPLSTPLTAFRIGFLGLWTFTVLELRQDVQTGRLFAAFGADPTGFEGQMLLLAIVLASLVVAVFVFRGPKPKKPTGPGATAMSLGHQDA